MKKNKNLLRLAREIKRNENLDEKVYAKHEFILLSTRHTDFIPKKNYYRTWTALFPELISYYNIDQNQLFKIIEKETIGSMLKAIRDVASTI